MGFVPADSQISLKDNLPGCRNKMMVRKQSVPDLRSMIQDKQWGNSALVKIVDGTLRLEYQILNNENVLFRIGDDVESTYNWFCEHNVIY